MEFFWDGDGFYFFDERVKEIWIWTLVCVKLSRRTIPEIEGICCGPLLLHELEAPPHHGIDVSRFFKLKAHYPLQ